MLKEKMILVLDGGPSPLRGLLLKFLVAILKRIPSSLDSYGKSRLRNEFECRGILTT